MSAMSAVSGPFTWRVVDRVGLAMMDFCFSYTDPLELCVCVCVGVCVCISQKDVRHRGVFMRRSGSG